MNNAIELALKTWYPKDHPLHNDLRHPLIKLAGECGELLDLYGKHEYKPNFDWMNCKHCDYGDASHSRKNNYCPIPIANSSPAKYTPIVLDELGDIWYYIRITSYITSTDLVEIKSGYSALFKNLVGLNLASSKLLYQFCHDKIVTFLIQDT